MYLKTESDEMLLNHSVWIVCIWISADVLSKTVNRRLVCSVMNDILAMLLRLLGNKVESTFTADGQQ